MTNAGQIFLFGLVMVPACASIAASYLGYPTVAGCLVLPALAAWCWGAVILWRTSYDH